MHLTPEQLFALRSTPIGAAANRLKLARTIADLKQNDVAAATDFTSPQLSDLERGEYKDVPLENARRLAQFFGCRIEDLFPARAADGTVVDTVLDDRRDAERRTDERRTDERRDVERREAERRSGDERRVDR